MASRSDVKIAKQAERFFYKDLLDNGIEIYEYQRTILHGKITVCDKKWLTTGSYNINNISAFASIELNRDVYDPRCAAEIDDMLQEIIDEDCMRITKRWLEKKANIFERIIQWSSYQAIRLLFYLCTFYFKRQA
jgi:cardiolipin synthase